MSSPQRRKELKAEREIAEKLRDDEDLRKANLSIWERIEETDASRDVKNILHLFAEKLRDDEDLRKANLSIWERIEETDASRDVKNILHLFAEKLRLEL